MNKKTARRKHAALRTRIRELEAENAHLRDELDLEFGCGGPPGPPGPPLRIVDFPTSDYVPGFEGQLDYREG